MAAVICEVHLPDNNGMPADDTINTFVFQDSNPATDPGTLAIAVHPAVDAFYNTDSGGGGVIATFLASNLTRTVDKCQLVFYELAPTGTVTPALPLGGPIESFDMTLGAYAGADLPREVAAVLSFAGPHAGIAEDVPGGPVGPKGDTHPAARHRGRIYLGPLTASVVGAGPNGPGLTVPFLNVCTSAAAAMGTAVGVLPGDTVSWCVWSRKNNALYPITQGWMDNAFDTQRRRGIKATVRTPFTV